MRRNIPYRTLAVVYALAIVLAACEFLRWPIGVQDDPQIYGAPDHSYPEAMARLYEGSAVTEYLLGRRAELLAARNFNSESRQNPENAVPHLMADLNSAARHYEAALAGGLNSEEDLYYNYALTLARIGAEPSRVDRAIAAWRRHFPDSDRPDLERRRQAIERDRRQLLRSAGP